jgi:hypothetical protein
VRFVPGSNGEPMGIPDGALVLVAMVGAVAGIGLLDAIIRRTMVGVVLVLAVLALTTAGVVLPEISVAGTRIDIWDLVATALLAAALARLLRSRRIAGLVWVLIALCAVTLLSVLIGVLVYGLNPAMNEFRPYFWFLSVALYTATIRPDRWLLDRVGYAWMVLAGAVLALSLFRWAAPPLGGGGWATPAAGDRPVSAAATLVMLQGAIIGAVAWARGIASIWMRRLTPLLLGGVVLMQHRTVWAVLLATLAVVVITDRSAFHRLIPVLVAGSLAVLAVGVAVLDRGVTELQEDLTEAATYRDTWEWRVDGWRALLDESGPEDLAEVLVGRPFGVGWERVVDGQTVEDSPHNFYVQSYLRTGVVGIVLLILLYGIAVRRLHWARREPGLLAAGPLLLVLAGHLIYFVAYSPGPEQGILFGLAIATAASLVAWPSLSDASPTGASVGR